MDRLNASIEKGSIKLNRIASFPARTIFIDVLNQGLVSRAYKAVQGALAGLDFIEDRIPVESFHPHITLMTRDLSKKFYYPAFEALKDMEFEEEIDISSITLFRHDGKKWQGIKQIPLKN
jgi:2'-5' RNA ligase